MGEVSSLPLVPRMPDQLPEAVQLPALVVDQLSVLVAPLATVAGLAVRVTVGMGCEVSLPRPALPLQPAATMPINNAPPMRNMLQECCFIVVTAGCTGFPEVPLRCALAACRTLGPTRLRG
jgi:hypothetical protein